MSVRAWHEKCKNRPGPPIHVVNSTCKAANRRSGPCGNSPAFDRVLECPPLPRAMGKTSHMANARSGARTRNRMRPRPSAPGCGLIHGLAMLCQKGGSAPAMWGAWHRLSGPRPRGRNNPAGAHMGNTGGFWLYEAGVGNANGHFRENGVQRHCL